VQITDVEVFLLHRRFVLLKVSTDDGVSGWGEAAFHGGAITATIARHLGQQIIGRDPFAIAAIWRDLFQAGYRIGSTGAHMAALAAIDIALHDLKGRALGTPVWNLLGGKVRDRVPVYSSLMLIDATPAEDVERIQQRLAQGHRAVKVHTAKPWSFDAGPDRTVATVRAVREACGADFRLLVDVNQAYTVPSALRVGRVLEEHDVGHFEEPIAPWDLDGYRRLRDALDVPLAAGEQEYNLWQFRDLVTRGCLDILQPNVTSCGGFTQAMKIVALAEAHNRIITTHNTEPTLTTAAHLHLWAVAAPCGHEQEYFGEDQHPLLHKTPVLTDPPVVVDGHLTVPDGPGLGVEVDEDRVRHAAEAHP
jgi:L-alanine-DL-glutamate epimerase-like enolase superfamily enzyme